ncbi:hypothetical protein PFICI_00175 [Pestalotiopsis fici W106-1]|uniref:Histidine kinase n=1 Tax=Pestalotiopsis fici (strain W106-1 / CGMCC3.15140) TaxID=1229662 RepID=W3XLL1_PESFW|nr:uncharacterized protein PFICI_00175 [Pestalotiopsis fici W106-1]ETS86347.1 hypothetical protein PFICI_00175 [Pestalotiopsis fici W106-1]
MPVASRRASSASSAELGRQRNLNRYYQPWLNTKKLGAVPPASNLTAFSEAGASPRVSHDTTLTALAQLAALRLNVKRAMVSLIDTTTQIILAEATQTLSLVDESRHAPGDNIWLGNVLLPRHDCMDEHALSAKTACEDAHGEQVQMSGMVVNDTFLDDRFKDRVYVTTKDGVRFYAGVPIITKEGHSIGVYGVSDTRPRPNGLTHDEMQFMQDVAEIVAEHLSRVLDSVGRVSERDFMKGISYFLEDQSEFKYRLSNSESDTKKLDTAKDTSIQATDPQPSPPPSRGRSNHQGVSSVGNIRSASPSRVGGKEEKSTAAGTRAPRFSRDIGPQDKGAPTGTDDNTHRIFAQASQVFCDQGKATGCVFVDASSSIFATSPAEGSCPPTSIDPVGDQEDLDFDTSEDLSDGSSQSANVLNVTVTAEDDNSNFSQGIISRTHLRKCILRYPFGKSFYVNKGRIVADQLDAAGGLAGEDDGGEPNSNLLTQSRKLLPPEVLECIPDAKWIIFLPLFNYARSQWCAAGFIWGNDFKMGDPDEALPFFKAFGCCMMSEFESMEVLNMNIAKSTFIASVSHDLRSPLHGMLGSLEFLEDSMTSAYQMSLVSSMETCGKTLLDTIDHLLDYAKINNLNRTSTPARMLGNRDPSKSQNHIALTSQEISGPTCFDFSLLLEEVVEAVFVGQTFRKVTLRNRDSVDEASAEIKAMSLDDSSSADDLIHEGSAKFSGRVCLVLNIEKSPTWCVQGRAGALRRVIMNVVGNAIKYCKKGYIEVSAAMEAADVENTTIRFSVKDTGIGMSEDFMTNHLFKAFSQEDSFTPGTGLGLSITAQIVDNLGGRIRIDSEKGVGTHVHVTLPMKTAPPTSCILGHDDLVSELEKLSTGKKLCILNPKPPKKPTILEKSGSKLESSITAFCRDWFHMTCVQDHDVANHPDAQLYIYVEPPPIEELLNMHHEQVARGESVGNAALLIICTNAFEAAALRAAGVDHLTSLGRIVEVTSQPVGLRKLAKIVLQCLIRIEKAELAATTENSSMSSRQSVDIEVQKRAAEVRLNTLSVVDDPRAGRDRPHLEELRWKSDEPRRKLTFVDSSAAGSLRTLGRKDDSFEDGIAQPASPMGQDFRDRTRHLPRVLLVDDNAINLKLLVTFVKKIKLPYAEATNGLEAFTKYKDADAPFDYVLMDLQMPVMDGFEATRKIRELESERGITKPVTIIAITGVGNDRAREDALEAGMSRYLTKPVKFKELQHLLIS